MQTSVPYDAVMDPDELALLAVQQYLRDMGFSSGRKRSNAGFQAVIAIPTARCCTAWTLALCMLRLHAHPMTCSVCPAAALQSIEQQTQRKFLDSKLPRGSMLLEVCMRA